MDGVVFVVIPAGGEGAVGGVIVIMGVVREGRGSGEGGSEEEQRTSGGRHGGQRKQKQTDGEERTTREMGHMLA